MNENVPPDIFSKFNHHPDSTPDFWDVLPLKRISKIRYGLSQPPAESPTGLPLIRATNIKSGKILIKDMMYVDPTDIPFSKDAILSKGDIIVVRSGAYTGDSAIIPNEYDGAIAGYDIIVTLLKDFSPFVAWQLLSPHVREFQFELNSLRAAQPHLNAEQLGETLIFVPTIPEQHAIAAFLDRETAKIDDLIEKKRRLISLLEEKRAAIISHAVTKGLDPNAPMKDSGVEWLGEIPAHWIVAPVYARYRVQLGKMLDAKRISGEHLAPYLRNIDVQWDQINTIDLPKMDFLPSEKTRFQLQPGDLLVCEGGEVGRTGMWNGELDECYYQKAIHRLRPYQTIDKPRYFYYMMYAAAKRGLFIAGGNPNTIDHLTAEKLRRHRFPFPPPDEQEAVVMYLNRETAKIDALISKIHEAINKLQEYRTALISAAVTGKIDVREASL